MPFKTVYEPPMLQSVIACGAEGGHIVERCVSIGISEKTYYNWITQGGPYYNPEFAEAHEEAELLCYNWWLEVSRTHMVQKGKDAPRLDARNWQLNMMNRFGWGLKNDNKNENTEIVINDGGSDAPSHD